MQLYAFEFFRARPLIFDQQPELGIGGHRDTGGFKMSFAYQLSLGRQILGQCGAERQGA